MAIGTALALEGLKAGFGAFQAIKGARDLKNLQRTEYAIPQEIQQNLSESERMALEGMPAEQKVQYVQNLQRGMQSGLKNLSSRKAGLAGIPELVQSQSDAFTNLVAMDATARQQNRMINQQNRQTMAQYKDKAFQTNQMQPYEEAATEAQSNLGAGVQNIFSALDMGSMLSAYKDKGYAADQYAYNMGYNGQMPGMNTMINAARRVYNK